MLLAFYSLLFFLIPSPPEGLAYRSFSIDWPAPFVLLDNRIFSKGEGAGEGEAHPLHVSVSEINYSEKDKALQITSRIFIDDLELSIRHQRKEPDMDLLAPNNGLTT